MPTVKVCAGLFLVSLWSAAACTAGESESVPQSAPQAVALQQESNMSMTAQTLFAAAECGTAGQGATGLRRIKSAQELSGLYQQLYANTISDKPVAVPAVDFITTRVFFISMGQRNTGGYAVRLADRPVTIRDDKAILSIDWITPPKGAMTLQVLTNPCLLFSLPLSGYRSLELVDQSGKRRAVFTL